MPSLVLVPVGVIRSEIKRRSEAPRQGREGAPDAWIEIEERFKAALDGIGVGDAVVVITWLHQANRDQLKVHPRGETTAALRGVFDTRSPDRPNPLGLHRVTVREVAGCRLKVGPLEAIDGTAVVDIKPVLEGSNDA